MHRWWDYPGPNVPATLTSSEEWGWGKWPFELEKGSIWVDFFEVESIFHSCGGQGGYRSYEKWSTLDVGCGFCGFYLHHTQKLDKLMESHAREMLSAVFQCNCFCPPVYPGNCEIHDIGIWMGKSSTIGGFSIAMLIIRGYSFWRSSPISEIGFPSLICQELP